jgi:hypothetical protein
MASQSAKPSSDVIAGTEEVVLAAQQAIERVPAAGEGANVVISASQEAIHKSETRLSMRVPRPAPLLPAEQNRERWRIAAQIAERLKKAGYSCTLSGPLGLN